jgi:hypothetical protein
MQIRENRIDRDSSPNGTAKSGALTVQDKARCGVELHTRMVIDVEENVKVESVGNMSN